ncbi:MAG TPA: alpha/beta hydrolase [Syntrophales bacterium]|nr:alpha/beta hydrolase [Syntrophales bacterium]
MLHEIASFALIQEDDGKYRRWYDREVLSHFDNYDLRPCLGNIKCPSLIIRGKESRVMGNEVAKEMTRMIPLGRFVELPMATHPLHTDNLIEFQRVIFDFLDELAISSQ